MFDIHFHTSSLAQEIKVVEILELRDEKRVCLGSTEKTVGWLSKGVNEPEIYHRKTIGKP